MENEIYLFGEVGWDITIKDVIEQVKETNPDEPLIVNIHSVGGSVFEGLAIYNYLKGLDREIHTQSTGLVASIATIIFLAGTKRTLYSTSQFLIHLPMAWADGNAEDLEKTAEQLRVIENQLAEIYSKETDLTKEEAIEKMKLDEFSEIDYLLDKKFVTDVIEFQAVASIFTRKDFKNNKNKNNNNNKSKIMSKKKLAKKEAKNKFLKLWSKIENYFEPQNKTVTDGDGVIIDFPDIEDDATPAVGDSAQVDGKSIDDGDRVMPNEDVWTFKDGKLDKITPKESDDDSEEVEDLKDEVEALKKTNLKIQGKLDSEIDAHTETKKSNKKSLKKIKAEMEVLAGAFGSDFNYKGNKQRRNPENVNEDRTFIKSSDRKK